MRLAYLLPLALGLGGCATTRPMYEYLRSNSDGSEAERILVYRPFPDMVEVVKMRARCTNAAYVTAKVDRAAGYANWLSAGRLQPGAMRQEFGRLTYDDAAHTITVTLGNHVERLTIAPGPWHLYDFDLASLTAVHDGQRAPRRDIRFALPMVWNGEGPMLRDLGQVTLQYLGEERRDGALLSKYLATGDNTRFKGGPIWLDARNGHVVAVEWGTPNHAEYRDYRLRMTDMRRNGAAAWKVALTDHLRDCTVE